MQSNRPVYKPTQYRGGKDVNFNQFKKNLRDNLEVLSLDIAAEPDPWTTIALVKYSAFSAKSMATITSTICQETPEMKSTLREIRMSNTCHMGWVSF